MTASAVRWNGSERTRRRRSTLGGWTSRPKTAPTQYCRAAVATVRRLPAVDHPPRRRRPSLGDHRRNAVPSPHAFCICACGIGAPYPFQSSPVAPLLATPSPAEVTPSPPPIAAPPPTRCRRSPSGSSTSSSSAARRRLWMPADTSAESLDLCAPTDSFPATSLLAL